MNSALPFHSAFSVGVPSASSSGSHSSAVPSSSSATANSKEAFELVGPVADSSFLRVQLPAGHRVGAVELRGYLILHDGDKNCDSTFVIEYSAESTETSTQLKMLRESFQLYDGAIKPILVPPPKEIHDTTDQTTPVQLTAAPPRCVRTQSTPEKLTLDTLRLLHPTFSYETRAEEKEEKEMQHTTEPSMLPPPNLSTNEGIIHLPLAMANTPAITEPVRLPAPSAPAAVGPPIPRVRPPGFPAVLVIPPATPKSQPKSKPKQPNQYTSTKANKSVAKAVDKKRRRQDEYDSSDTWPVHKIMARRVIHGREEYRVHWCDRKGVPWRASDPAGFTWEPIENLTSCEEMIQEFRKELKQSLLVTPDTKTQSNGIKGVEDERPRKKSKTDLTITPFQLQSQTVRQRQKSSKLRI